MKADQVKANGVHYTPPELAKFLAEVVAERLSVGTRAIEILDPACGDGALLVRVLSSRAVPGTQTGDPVRVRNGRRCVAASGRLACQRRCSAMLFSNSGTFWRLRELTLARGEGNCPCSTISSQRL